MTGWMMGWTAHVVTGAEVAVAQRAVGGMVLVAATAAEVMVARVDRMVAVATEQAETASVVILVLRRAVAGMVMVVAETARLTAPSGAALTVVVPEAKATTVGAKAAEGTVVAIRVPPMAVAQCTVAAMAAAMEVEAMKIAEEAEAVSVEAVLVVVGTVVVVQAAPTAVAKWAVAAMAAVATDTVANMEAVMVGVKEAVARMVELLAVVETEVVRL
jgi:hypothetical protein